MRRFVKESKKKAFTLVELLVVIAILAILAGVSVVGYLGFTEKANKSVDEQMCTQYNTLLQAESVLNEEISLADFVIMIEENGINSNHFNTLSKAYAFGYHPEGKKCYLLDKKTGEILYPESNGVAKEEIWAALNPQLNIIPGIHNYTLLQSQEYGTTRPAAENVTYNFDLNNHAFHFNTEPTFKMNLKNGILVTPDGTKKDNMTIDETVNIVKAQDVSMVKDKNELKNKFENSIQNTGTVYTIENKQFYSTNAEKLTVETSAYLKDKEVSKVIVKNCVFDNIRLNLRHSEVIDYEVTGCKFFNTQSYVLDSNKAKDLTITNNEVINSNRSFNINLGEGTTTISNNTFNLAAIQTDNKDERKDNAIQLAFGNMDQLFNDWRPYTGHKVKPGNVKAEWEKYYVSTTTPTLKDTVKVVISNNTVSKALAFVTVHVSAIQQKTETEYKAIKEQLLTSNVFTFETNTLSEGISKVSADPGAKEDITNSDIASKTSKYAKFDFSDTQTKKDNKLKYYETQMIPAMEGLVK